MYNPVFIVLLQSVQWSNAGAITIGDKCKEFPFFDNINYRYGISAKHHLICAYALNITPMYFFGNVIVPYYYNEEKNIFEIDKSNAPFIKLEQVYY